MAEDELGRLGCNTPSKSSAMIFFMFAFKQSDAEDQIDLEGLIASDTPPLCLMTADRTQLLFQVQLPLTFAKC